MRSGNLAIVFGPSLLYERNATAAAADAQQHQGKLFVFFVFVFCTSIWLRNLVLFVKHCI
jgi:hypothetical protein